MSKFNVGDVVVLKSGGQPMTVNRVYEKPKEEDCPNLKTSIFGNDAYWIALRLAGRGVATSWMDTIGVLHRDNFHEDELVNTEAGRIWDADRARYRS